MRDDILMQLVDKATSDPGFRAKALADLDGALSEAGFDLTDEELAAVREFQARTQGKSDAEIDEALAGGARRQFPPGT
jgi:hypothetical protein